MHRYSRPAGIQQPCHGINDFHSRVLFVFPGHQRSPAERQGKKGLGDNADSMASDPRIAVRENFFFKEKTSISHSNCF